MKSHEQTSNFDDHNLHNGKATLQFAVIDCACILLWYSFPHRPRMVDNTFWVGDTI